MISSNNKISIRQLQTLLILDTFGTGIIILPRIATKWANSDAWMTILGATIIAVVFAFVLHSLASLFPNDSFVEFSYKIVSPTIGFVISLLFAAKLIFTAGIELRIFGEIVGQTMLYNTPLQIVMIVMVLTASYLVYKGYENRARLCEALFFVVFVPLFVVFTIAAFGADFSNLQPAFHTSPYDISQGAYAISFSFRGMEFILLVYPFINKPKRAFKGHLLAIIFTCFIMLVITIITIAKFGAEDTSKQLWPVLQIMDSIDIPGSLLERQDALILSFWIISVFISISAGVFFSSLILSKIFTRPAYHRDKGMPFQNIYILPSAAIIFSVSMLPQNLLQAYAWLSFSDMTVGITYLFILPCILLIIARLRKMNVKEASK